MRFNIAFRSGVSGVVVGSLLAGGLWWLDAPLSLVALVGSIWATATTALRYISHSQHGNDNEGPWGGVAGLSLLTGVGLNLSDISVSNEIVAALTVLTMGFTLLGYAGGVTSSSP